MAIGGTNFINDFGGIVIGNRAFTPSRGTVIGCNATTNYGVAIGLSADAKRKIGEYCTGYTLDLTSTLAPITWMGGASLNSTATYVPASFAGNGVAIATNGANLIVWDDRGNLYHPGSIGTFGNNLYLYNLPIPTGGTGTYTGTSDGSGLWTYTYYIRSVSYSSCSSAASSAITVSNVPFQTSSLSSSRYITLNWTPVPNVYGYDVYGRGGDLATNGNLTSYGYQRTPQFIDNSPVVPGPFSSSSTPYLTNFTTSGASTAQVVVQQWQNQTQDIVEFQDYTGANLVKVDCNGIFFPVQGTTTNFASLYQKGAVYFDTTLNKLRIGGATGWETVTSS